MSASEPEAVGPYLVYEQLGQGGMATVHRAVTRGVEGFRRPIALKRLLPHLASDPALVKSFVQEARLASHLHHANVAATYDLGCVDDTYFIAMEYVPGATLAQISQQCGAIAGRVPIPVVLSVLMQICDALDHAHNRCDPSGNPLGIIHRDVSPANVIVSNTGVVKLIDFGIARAESAGGHTLTSVSKGELGYVAPEYTTGQLDARCDLFAVGVIAHELLTGHRLFDAGSDFDTVQRLREAPLHPPSRSRREVPPDLDAIVMTALERDPELRWQSASAMRAALANLAREARLEISHAQVLQWVEWAFTQRPPEENTNLSRVLAMLSEPSTVSAELTPEQQHVLEHTPPTRPSVSGAAMPAVEVAPARTEPAQAPMPSAARPPGIEADPPPVTAGLAARPIQYPTARGGRRWRLLLIIALVLVLAGAAGYQLSN